MTHRCNFKNWFNDLIKWLLKEQFQNRANRIIGIVIIEVAFLPFSGWLWATAALLQLTGAGLQPAPNQRDLPAARFLHLAQGRPHQTRRPHRQKEVQVIQWIHGKHVTVSLSVSFQLTSYVDVTLTAGAYVRIHFNKLLKYRAFEKRVSQQWRL